MSAVTSFDTNLSSQSKETCLMFIDLFLHLSLHCTSHIFDSVDRLNFYRHTLKQPPLQTDFKSGSILEEHLVIGQVHLLLSSFIKS